MKCIFCLNPIENDQTYVGAGDGTGKLFVHREICYDYLAKARKELHEEQTGRDIDPLRERIDDARQNPRKYMRAPEFFITDFNGFLTGLIHILDAAALARTPDREREKLAIEFEAWYEAHKPGTLNDNLMLAVLRALREPAHHC